MVKLTELFEKDRERLLTQLEHAGSPERTVPVLEETLDHLLLDWQGQCSEETTRELGASLLQTARMTLRLADTAGETKIWINAASSDTGAKHQAAEAGKKWTGTGIALLLLALAAGLFLVPPVPGTLRALAELLLLGSGGFFLFFGGKKLGGAKGSDPGAGRGDERAEITVDTKRICRIFEEMLQMADRELQEWDSRESWRQRQKDAEEKEQVEGQLPGQAVTLLSDLLEALYSQDGMFALERLADVRYYLHTLGVELLDYDGKNAEKFDLMPSRRQTTLRPALLQGDRVLRRGLASGGE